MNISEEYTASILRVKVLVKGKTSIQKQVANSEAVYSSPLNVNYYHNEEWCLLGCYAVKTSNLTITLYGITSQKKELIVNTVRT
jgi:hypothetical protein